MLIQKGQSLLKLWVIIHFNDAKIIKRAFKKEKELFHKKAFKKLLLVKIKKMFLNYKTKIAKLQLELYKGAIKAKKYKLKHRKKSFTLN